MEKDNLVQPVLKWAGGKRQMLSSIMKQIPKDVSIYCEPFVGGGAVLFKLQPQKAIVNDINSELINVYLVIRDDVEELIEDLKKHKSEKDYFYRMRDLDRNREEYEKLTPVQKASRFMYLNKTCYNGLFRVNRLGQFNVPFGNYKNPGCVNERVLKAVSRYFNEAVISFFCEDFERILLDLTKEIFVYLDPPYYPLSDTSYFTGYSKYGFGREEHVRLKQTCDRLNEKGVRFLLSNSATDFVKDLYKDYRIQVVQARRVINSKADKRGKIDEVFIMNY